MTDLPPAPPQIPIAPPVASAAVAGRAFRGQFLLAWLAIAAVGGTIVYWQNVVRPGTAAGSQKESAQQTYIEFLMRYHVGVPEFMKSFEGQVADQEKEAADKKQKEALEQLVKSVEGFNKGSVEQRIRVLIALGEIVGPQRVREELEKMKADAEKANHKLTPEEQARLELLDRLYKDYVDQRFNAPAVTPQEREELIRDLGWLGELALTPHDPNDPDNVKRRDVMAVANQTMMIVVVVFAGALIALGLGVVGLFILAILSIKGIAKSQMYEATDRHAVYVETFALWLPAFFGIYQLIPLLGLGNLLPEVGLLMLPFVLSLSILAWPVLRGIPWRQVRQDIGLTFGQQPLLEPMLGIVSYLNSLPFLLVGIALFMMLTRLVAPQGVAPGDPFRPEPSFAHPLINNLRNATAADILPYFLLMSVCAPITEEIMFRGCLYRHLRDATRGQFLCVTFSAIASGIVFAAVHPQGLLAIPILASLACGFALAREWRGTLIPSIIAHGINNGIVLAVVLALFTKW